MTAEALWGDTTYRIARNVVLLLLLVVAPLLLRGDLLGRLVDGEDVGIDIATYTYWAQLTINEEGVPDLEESDRGLTHPARLFPGYPILLATLSQVTGLEVTTLARFFPLVVLVLSSALLYLLLVRIFDEWIAFLGLILWVFFQSVGDAPVAAGIQFLPPWLSPGNLVGFALILLFLLGARRFAGRRSPVHVLLLGALVGSALIYHALTFLLMALFFFTLLALYRRRVSWRITVPMLIIGGGLVAAARPPYLSAGSVQTNREAAVGSGLRETGIDLLEIPSQWGYAATALVVVGLVALMAIRAYRGDGGRFHLYLALCLLPVAVLMSVGPSLLGIRGARFLYFGPLLVVPLSMYGVYYVTRLRPSLLAPAMFAGLATASIVLGIPQQLGDLERFGDRFFFQEEEQEAARWLRDNAGPHEVVLADLRGARDTAWVAPYSERVSVFRPATPLFVHSTPPPYDLPIRLLDAIEDDPSQCALAKQAHDRFGFTYYYYSRQFQGTLIERFDRSDCFVRLFKNAKALIFGFTEPATAQMPALHSVETDDSD